MKNEIITKLIKEKQAALNRKERRKILKKTGEKIMGTNKPYKKIC